ncbi:uncharacterized protein LOC133197397 [Saccostrea echinata]|uniref:uncharacterized protein LOC133197397 n=1 Tax=Saccostrea echinata TaxID=191078 RepID=UPI002A817EC6|nr:uncharacterized protein LOC133197397 [Saccostrea echinata]
MSSHGTRTERNQNGGPKRVKTRVLANLDYPDINNALFHTLNIAKNINPQFYGYSCHDRAGTLEMYRTRNQPISCMPVCFNSVMCHFQDRCANTRTQICTRTTTFGMYVKQKYECVMQIFRGSIVFQLEFQNEEGYQRYMNDFHNGTLKQEIIDFFKNCYKDFGLDPDDLEFNVSVEDSSGNPEDNNNLPFSDRNLTSGNENTAPEEQSMETSTSEQTVKKQHNDLLQEISKQFLDEDIENGQNLRKFRKNVMHMFPDLLVENLSVPEIFSVLDDKGHLKAGSYDTLVSLVKDIDPRMVNIIRATEKILSEEEDQVRQRGNEDKNKSAEEVRNSGEPGMLSSRTHVSLASASAQKVPKVMDQLPEERSDGSAGTSSAQSGNSYNVGNITAHDGMVAFGNSGSVKCKIGKRDRPTTEDEGQKTQKRGKIDFQASSAGFRKEKDDSLRGKELKNFYSHGWDKSVGHLLCGNKTGTAFRVGDRYLMTAYHIIKDALDWYLETIISKAQSDPDRVNCCTPLLENLRKLGTVIEMSNCGTDIEMKIENGIRKWAEKNVDIVNFSSLLEVLGVSGFSLAKVQASKEITQNRMSVVFGRLIEQEDILPYPLKLDIPFYSSSDDIAILEVDWTNLPKPFNLQRSNIPPKSVHIIGYPASHKSEQILDPHCPLISLAEAQSTCQRAVDWWKKEYPTENVDDFRNAYSSAFTGQGKIQFHCSESTAHGASGSPGLIQMHEEKPVVSLMLQQGFPSFVYEQKHQELLKTVPKQFLIESGISMSRVYEILSNKPHLLALRNEIFHT